MSGAVGYDILIRRNEAETAVYGFLTLSRRFGCAFAYDEDRTLLQALHLICKYIDSRLVYSIEKARNHLDKIHLSCAISYPQQTSCIQQLEKGKLYYIEALHSNYINNDHVRVHIKYPGSNTTTPLDIEHLFLYSPGKLDL